MQDDHSNPRLFSRVCMPSRSSAQSSDVPRRRLSSASSTSFPVSISISGLPPLTPRNTFDDTYFDDVLSDQSALEPDEMAREDEPLHYVRPLGSDTTDKDDEGDEGYESWDTAHWPENAAHREVHQNDLRSSMMLRKSTSVPVPALRNMFASASGCGSHRETDNHGKKRIHFDDNSSCPTLEALQRRQSAPATTSKTGNIFDVDHTSFDEENNNEDTYSSQGLEDFKGEADDLTQYSNEDDEACEELLGIFRGATRAMLEDESTEYGSEDEQPPSSEGQYSEYESDGCTHHVPASGHIRLSSADEDVDETCIVAEGLFVDDTAENEWDDPLRHLEDTAFTRPMNYRATDERDFSRKLAPVCEGNKDHSSSSIETVIGPMRRIQLLSGRRSSESHVYSGQRSTMPRVRRSASMLEFSGQTLQRKVKSRSSEAKPVVCVVTIANGGYTVLSSSDTPANSLSPCGDADALMQGSEVINTEYGYLQAIWTDHPSATSSCITLLEGHANSPIDKIKIKLASWKWLKENNVLDEDGRPAWLGLLSFEGRDAEMNPTTLTPCSEGPYAPPNTERASGPSSGRHSAARSLVGDDDQQDEDPNDELDNLSELEMARPSSTGTSHAAHESYRSSALQPSLDVPNLSPKPKFKTRVPRQLSNLALEEAHFRTHRDSVQLLRHKEELEERLNASILHSQDSMILTRGKYDDGYYLGKRGCEHDDYSSPGSASMPDKSSHDVKRRTVWSYGDSGMSDAAGTDLIIDYRMFCAVRSRTYSVNIDSSCRGRCSLQMLPSMREA